MSVPSYEELLQPILEALRQLSGFQSITAINRHVISFLPLATEEIALRHGDTKQTELEYRLAWARTYLKHYGLIDNPKRGVWTLTEQGRATEQVDPKMVSTFVQELIKQGKIDTKKPDDELSDEPNLDIAQRLARWRQEATDTAHPNHHHADLDHAAHIYAKVSPLLQKLRTTPDEFSSGDVIALFGMLNSGHRMKNRVADKNPLPVLREALLALIDGPGTPADKIAVADQSLKFASYNMLGELYGWANAETAPLYNGCATAALHYLGYTFNDKDYAAFVAAHEQFKQVYQQQVGYLRPDLPLNLEIDKLYNVIDKVDLKKDTQRTLAKPFSEMFASWEEAESAFDTLAVAAHQLGITDPADERIAVNLRYKDGKHQLRLSYGWWLLLGFAGADGALQEVILALFSGQSLLQPLRVEQFKQGPDEQPVSLYWYSVSQLRPFDGEVRPIFEATLQHVKAKFAHWVRCPYRIHTKDAIIAAVFDPTARAKLLGQGWPPKDAQFEDVIDQGKDELDALVDQPEAHPPQPGVVGSPFTSRTFELLEGIHATPTKGYYQANKEAFKKFVEEPFQRVMHQVAERLRAPVKAVMETESHIFARFLKNDWGQGGAWEFYWGAFYPKEGKRTEDAQLSMWIDYRLLEYGFFIGDYASTQRQRFQRNCQTFGSALLPYLRHALPETLVRFADRDDFQVSADGAITIKTPLTWEEFLKDPAQAKNDVSVIVPRQQLLALSEEELVTRITETYAKLFPLVLLATDDDPLPAIHRYLQAVGFATDEPDIEPPASYDLQKFLARTYLQNKQADDLYHLLLDKKQIILYGPPGTGKSHVAQELAKWITGLAQPPADRVEMVQFHPAYSYEDFIEGIRPESKPTGNGGFTVDYPPRAGVFRRFCKVAQANPDQPHVFIIDEINRGNIPRIFDKLMLLLEYRKRDVPLPYSGERFRIPPNVYLIGTMNTADRSIALVDFALRRRFHFFHFMADPDLLDRWLVQNPLPTIPYLANLYRRLSQEAIDDPDYAVGFSYFMDKELTPTKLALIWQYSILPYLAEYHVEQRARVKNWEWDSDFMREIRRET
ncbi:MAG: AAA family ATPase [Anaerolineae bacterium]|uniref:AAA family ATPase n=1 Tax=Candidatus Amarolinea dominans TaxID=3140696 RepID=UPI0031351A25|nr:AAA family ATPase [Anaerolineae bacterium]